MKKTKRLHLFVWPFVVVGWCNGESFLSTAVGGDKEMMLAGEVVMVVGCFAALLLPCTTDMRWNQTPTKNGAGNPCANPHNNVKELRLC